MIDAGPGSGGRTRLLYFVYRELLASVIPAQVIAPLSHSPFKPELIAHVPIGHLLRPAWRGRLKAVTALAARHGLATHWLPAPPTRAPRLWSDVRVLRSWLERHRPQVPFVMHCRGLRMTALALEAAQHIAEARIVYDARGDEVAEAQVTNPEAVGELSALERSVLSRCHGVTAVSNALLKRLEPGMPAGLRSRTLVVPCCADAAASGRWLGDRDIIRRELGVQDRFVVCYLGSLAYYQQPALSLRVVQALHRLRGDVHFLALTTDKAGMERLIATSCPEVPAAVLSVPQEEVARLLVAADVGLLLRRKDPINRVASPVKFAEYLAAGVPVVISPELGDATLSVQRSGTGWVVDPDASDEALLSTLAQPASEAPALANQRRTRCRDAAAHLLDWSATAPSRTSLIERVASGPPT